MKGAEVKCNQLGVIDQLLPFNWGNFRYNCYQHLYNLMTLKSLVIDQLMKRINRRHVLLLRANSAIICFSIGPSGMVRQVNLPINSTKRLFFIFIYFLNEQWCTASSQPTEVDSMIVLHSCLSWLNLTSA